MKKNQGYSVDVIEGKITITKSFAKNAGTLNSAESKTFTALLKKYPEYVFMAKTVSNDKKKHKGLTYKAMENYINNVPNNKELLATFNAIKARYKNVKGGYPVIKKWFFAQESLAQFVKRQNADNANAEN